MQQKQDNKQKSITGMTFEEMKVLSAEEQERVFRLISKVRKDAKQANFSAMYGAGVDKMVLTSGMKRDVAVLLHATYWKTNWSVKQIAKECITKRIDEQMWLYNPVSGFWYSLRADKDRFSTLNQGTGSYAFDTWIRRIRMRGVKVQYQSHDEHLAAVLKTKQEEHRQILLDAIKETNNILKLNVTLGISIDFDRTYAGTH